MVFDIYPFDSHGVGMPLYSLFANLSNFHFKGLMFAFLNTMYTYINYLGSLGDILT